MAFSPPYVKHTLPIYTKVTEESELLLIGEVEMEIPVTVEAGRCTVELEDVSAALTQAFNVPTVPTEGTL